MPTPVGHALSGVAVYVATRRRESLLKDLPLAVACVGAALAPDLDFAVSPFAGRTYHHYFTHSLGFAALFWAAAFLVARFAGRAAPGRDAALLATAFLFHVLLDLLAMDPSPPFGIRLLWPLSSAFYASPVALFADIRRGSLAILFGLHNWWAAAREVLILGPVLALVWWWRGGRRP
jgi:membrane-bound metal-dependent hydrolase YbcI (DUF457 family)